MPRKPHKNIKIHRDQCHECYKNLKERTKITMQMIGPRHHKHYDIILFFFSYKLQLLFSLTCTLLFFISYLSYRSNSHSLLCFRMLWCAGVWKVRMVAGPSPSAVMAWTSSLYRLAGWRPDTSRVLLSWKRGEGTSSERGRRKKKSRRQKFRMLSVWNCREAIEVNVLKVSVSPVDLEICRS